MRLRFPPDWLNYWRFITTWNATKDHPMNESDVGPPPSSLSDGWRWRKQKWLKGWLKTKMKDAFDPLDCLNTDGRRFILPHEPPARQRARERDKRLESYARISPAGDWMGDKILLMRRESELAQRTPTLSRGRVCSLIPCCWRDWQHGEQPRFHVHK